MLFILLQNLGIFIGIAFRSIPICILEHRDTYKLSHTPLLVFDFYLYR